MDIPEDILVGEELIAAAVLDQLLLNHHHQEAEVGGKEYLMIMSLPLLYRLCLLIFHNFLILTSMVWILYIIHHYDMEVLGNLIHINHILIYSNNHYRHIFQVILISNKYRLHYHLIF
jgi:hypothetical protein